MVLPDLLARLPQSRRKIERTQMNEPAKLDSASHLRGSALRPSRSRLLESGTRVSRKVARFARSVA
jgi:hypothetical protein